MKEFIDQMNLAISNKRDRLKERADRLLSTIEIPTVIVSNSVQQTPKTPPISYILYGVAGLSAIGALASDSKILFVGLAAASAYGGYKLSQNISSQASSNQTSMPNINDIKNTVSAKVVDVVKSTTQEWESFMSAKQKELQNAIFNSPFSEAEKNNMTSKTFVYEVINISLLDFSNSISAVLDAFALKSALYAYKDKLLNAIDVAANRQMTKYSSIC